MTKICQSIIILSIIALQSCSSKITVGDKGYSKGPTITVEDKEYSNLQKTFRETYRKESYPIYKEKIIISKENDFIDIIYSEDTIRLNKEFSKYTCLFSSGLISSLIIGYHDSQLTRIDKVQELSATGLKHQSRVFKLYGVNKDFMNSFIWYVEIENHKAKKNGALELFIKGAKLTFFKTMILI